MNLKWLSYKSFPISFQDHLVAVCLTTRAEHDGPFSLIFSHLLVGIGCVWQTEPPNLRAEIKKQISKIVTISLSCNFEHCNRYNGKNVAFYSPFSPFCSLDLTSSTVAILSLRTVSLRRNSECWGVPNHSDFGNFRVVSAQVVGFHEVPIAEVGH